MTSDERYAAAAHLNGPPVLHAHAESGSFAALCGARQNVAVVSYMLGGSFRITCEACRAAAADLRAGP